MRIGERVKQIRVVEKLGSGGMGDVFVGFDETLQRRVALKTIRRTGQLEPEARARFLREARVLSQLEHPNICRIYDYVSTGEGELLVLELIDGKTLDEALEGDLGRHRRLEIALAVAGVLEAAHGAGIVHRDLKPGNVMLSRSGEVKVLDFGLARTGVAAQEPAPQRDSSSAPAESSDGAETSPLAPPEDETRLAESDAAASAPTLAADGREPGDHDETAIDPAGGSSRPMTVGGLLTVQGSVMGTPLFMSPEQARGEEVTTASDMYSFGLLLQTVFTGRAPYPPGIGVDKLIAAAQRGESLPVEGVDSELAALIGRLKSLAPAKRPTAVEARQRLRWIRDKPKRRLRRALVAAALLVAALGATKYTVDLRREREAAVAAQDLAERRRGQAEELIGFMLGDLRQKLEPVGRLEILDDVGREAMDYFAAVDEAELSDHELSSRSRALYQIGEVRIAQGDMAGAVEPLGESLELAKSLAERNPQDGERLFELGQAHFWVGFVHWRQGDLDAALAEFEAYLDLSERLVEMDPTRADWRLELNYGYRNIGAILQSRGEWTEALERFRAALGIVTELAAEQPEDLALQSELAHSHNAVGYVLAALGRYVEALEQYQEELAIKASLVEREPEHASWTYELAINRNIIGQLRAVTGSPEEALRLHRQAARALSELCKLDPNNSTWAWELGVTKRLVGRALLDRGDATAAEAELESSVTRLARESEKDPTSVGLRRELAASRLELAAARLAGGSAEAAGSLASRARDDLERQVTERPEDRSGRLWLGRAFGLLGEVAERLRQPEVAGESWRAAARVLEEITVGSSDHRVLEPWLRVLIRLGRSEEARQVLEQLRSFGYDAPAAWEAERQLNEQG